MQLLECDDPECCDDEMTVLVYFDELQAKLPAVKYLRRGTTQRRLAGKFHKHPLKTTERRRSITPVLASPGGTMRSPGGTVKAKPISSLNPEEQVTSSRVFCEFIRPLPSNDVASPPPPPPPPPPPLHRRTHEAGPKPRPPSSPHPLITFARATHPP